MQTLIDALSSFTGWSFPSAEVSAYMVNEYLEYVAGNTLTQSVVLKFSGANGKYAEKVFSTPINVSQYTEIVLSLWTRNTRGAGIDYKKPADFKYKIDFGTGKEFYLPVPFSFSDITIALNGITSIERIRITALHDEEDYMFLSYALAVKDEIPLDILTAIQERLEKEIADDMGLGYNVGTIASALAGDNVVVIGGDRFFCDKYGIVLIKDATKQEYIQLGENDERGYHILPTLNNGVLANSYTNATVYLRFPVVFGTQQKDIVLPSITIWGFTPEPVLRGSKVQSVFDTYKTTGTLNERRDAQIQLYRIFLQVESRWNEMNGIICQFVRNFLAREFLYINGRKYEIRSEIPAVEQEPVEGINDIFRHTYEAVIEVKEDIGKRVVLPVTTDVNGTVNIDE